MTDPDFETPPPHDIQSEMCALGSAMLSADAAASVVEDLTEDDFLREAHKSVFRAVRSLSDRFEAVNAVSVRLELQQFKGEGHIPDGSYILELIHHVPTVGSATFYIKALKSLSALRRLAEAGPAITRLGYVTAPEDANHAVETAQKLFDEATRSTAPSKAQPVSDLILPFLDRLESGGDKRGVTTGIKDLDDILSKLRPGQLITVGARPGMGKTALMAGIAHHVGVRNQLPVYIATLEMSTDEFMARLVALDCKVDLKALLEPDLLTDDDWVRLAKASVGMGAATTLVIDDDPALNIAQIRSGLRSMRRSGTPAALVIVDYLQLMKSAGRVESRQVEVGNISRALKLMAKEFEVPIVVGSQLNREVEHRADKQPTIADLRESGSVEQDSDVVILLNRPDVYDQESPRAGEIDVIVGKNRHGARGVATCAFQGRYSRVVDMAPEPKPVVASADPWTPTRCVS